MKSCTPAGGLVPSTSHPCGLRAGNRWEKKGRNPGISTTIILKDPRYSRVVKLDTGLSYDPDFHKNVRDFARTFDMEIVEVKGSVELAEKSYRAAKKGLIQHTWNNSKNQ